MEAPKKKKQTWNERRKALKQKPITGKSEQGEIKTYFLSPEELEYYRNLKPPVREKMIATTAARGTDKYTRRQGQK